MSNRDDVSLTIHSMVDVERARRLVRSFGLRAGLTALRTEELVLATSEVAVNLLKHASSGGVLACGLREAGSDSEVEVQLRDAGPGIADLRRALEDGFSTTGSLGSGLPAARRLVDSFSIESDTAGTVVRLGKRIIEP